MSRSAVIAGTLHIPQSMVLVSAKSGLRAQVHKSHLCFIETTDTHVKHNGFQDNHAHCMFKTYCDFHPVALHYGHTEILNWLRHENIDTVCETKDTTTGEKKYVDLLKGMVTKCKRHTEGKLALMDQDLDVNCNYADGKLLAMCQKYSLGATLARLGEAHFDAHTAYIIPEWSASSDRASDAGDMCVMLTTFNLCLNYSRAMKWYAGKVTLALDHTYKVRFLSLSSVRILVCEFCVRLIPAAWSGGQLLQPALLHQRHSPQSKHTQVCFCVCLSLFAQSVLSLRTHAAGSRSAWCTTKTPSKLNTLCASCARTAWTCSLCTTARADKCDGGNCVLQWTTHSSPAHSPAAFVYKHDSHTDESNIRIHSAAHTSPLFTHTKFHVNPPIHTHTKVE